MTMQCKFLISTCAHDVANGGDDYFCWEHCWRWNFPATFLKMLKILILKIQSSLSTLLLFTELYATFLKKIVRQKYHVHYNPRLNAYSCLWKKMFGTNIFRPVYSTAATQVIHIRPFDQRWSTRTPNQIRITISKLMSKFKHIFRYNNQLWTIYTYFRYIRKKI
jgi:hypothetical protein